MEKFPSKFVRTLSLGALWETEWKYHITLLCRPWKVPQWRWSDNSCHISMLLPWLSLLLILYYHPCPTQAEDGRDTLYENIWWLCKCKSVSPATYHVIFKVGRNGRYKNVFHLCLCLSFTYHFKILKDICMCDIQGQRALEIWRCRVFFVCIPIYCLLMKNICYRTIIVQHETV
jgi:hypothetical protein